MALVINKVYGSVTAFTRLIIIIGWITRAKREETRPKRLNQEKPIWEWSITRNEHEKHII